ncbi:MAG: hypothetical protein E4H27_05305, partial [Anaerolineales bacterium]
LLSAYLLGIGILTALFTATPFLPGLFGGSAEPSMLEIFTLGRNLFWVSGIILILASGVLIPITALGALAGERDNRTMDLLMVTTLRPWDIIWGKMLSACLTGLVYLIAPLPLVLTSFWLGGVSVAELLLLMLVVMVVMVLSCSWALFFSAIVRKTLSAVLLYYVLNLATIPILLVITVLLGNAYDVMSYSHSFSTTRSLFLATLVQYGWVLLCGFHPIYAAVASELLGTEHQSWFILHFDINHYDPLTDKMSLLGTVALPSPWIIYVILGVATSAVLLWLTTKRLGRVER